MDYYIILIIHTIYCRYIDIYVKHPYKRVRLSSTFGSRFIVLSYSAVGKRVGLGNFERAG